MTSRTHRSGFTLIELAVVLLLIGVIVGAGLAIFTSSLQATAYNKTVSRMDAVQNALAGYASVYNRIPCPSSLTLTSDYNMSGANYIYYGQEAANPGSCTGGTPAANFVAASLAVEGGVPTRALQLPDDYLYDGWGHRFRYAVDPLLTVAGALPVTSQCSLSSVPNASAITVTDSSGGTRSNKSIYVLLSMGANGHGSYTSSGAAVNAGSVNAGELTDCHCDSGGNSATYAPTYVEMAPTLDPSNRLNGYDDIVTFKEAWQMQTPDYPVTQGGTCIFYIYVVDQLNNRVEKFDSSGNYVSQFGSGLLNNPFAIAVDPLGNSYVSDQNNSRVVIFDNTGTFVSQFGGYDNSGAAGKFNGTKGIALDGSGNVYVVDNGNNRIEKFTSGGSYLSQIGLAGSGNGQLSGPVGVAIDASGNIWAGDYGNCRVEAFNANGSYLSQFGSCGSGNGQFQNAQTVAIDASGNIWATEGGGIRIQEFTPAGVFIRAVGYSSNSGGNGGFYSTGGVAFDPSGLVYIGDGGTAANARVQIFSSTGVYQNQFGSWGTGNGQFKTAPGIAISLK